MFEVSKSAPHAGLWTLYCFPKIHWISIIEDIHTKYPCSETLLANGGFAATKFLINFWPCIVVHFNVVNVQEIAQWFWIYVWVSIIFLCWIIITGCGPDNMTFFLKVTYMISQNIILIQVLDEMVRQLIQWNFVNINKLIWWNGEMVNKLNDEMVKW